MRRVSRKKYKWLQDLLSFTDTTQRPEHLPFPVRLSRKRGPRRYSLSQILSSPCVKQYLHQLQDTQKAQGTLWTRARG